MTGFDGTGNPSADSGARREEPCGNGLRNLVDYYRRSFEIEENINHYSRDDFEQAKRRFIKHQLKNRRL